MPLEVEATYEHGVLKLDQPLPLSDHERVVVSVRPIQGGIEDSAGLVCWTGDPQSLEQLLGPDNQPWEN